ncbi:lipopolysaccharide biosynthesis protein [Microbacterium sp. NPDC064584]|uniref:lipopolysaccharide biosynthesis protein n=1 Tax=Microbacterium sp. NPDC064584 TaxID=3155817 RepID=UPI0034226660
MMKRTARALPPVSLGAAASRGAAVTLGAQGLRIVIQLVGIVVLARLLTPVDYGLVTMILAIIGIADIVRDFGLGQAAVQAKEISERQKSNLFWINALIGLALTLIVIAASGAIAALYDTPELQPLTIALAVCFFLRGASVQFTANLTRSLQFGRLAGAETAGQVIGLVLAIILAANGAGAWALAWQQVAQVTVVLVLCAAFSRWVPRWYDRRTSIKPFVSFGAAVAGSHLLNYASKNVDSVVLGMRFGATSLGLYNRAFQLVTMPLTQLQAPATRVALPVLSKLQSAPERFAQFILTGQFAMLVIVGVVTSLCVSESDAIIRLALGREWLAAAPIFQVLAIGGAFQAATYASYWVFLALGLVKQNLYYALATRPLAIAMILIGSNWGVMGVAWAYTATLVLFWPVSLIWLSRVSDAPAKRMFVTGIRWLSVIGVATVGAYAVTELISVHSSVLRLLAGTAVTLLVIAVAGVALPGLRAQFRDAIALRRFFTRRAPRARLEGGSE